VAFHQATHLTLSTEVSTSRVACVKHTQEVYVSLRRTTALPEWKTSIIKGAKAESEA
jgi:hypothetical protein